MHERGRGGGGGRGGEGWRRDRCKEDTDGEKRWRGGDNGRTGDTENLLLYNSLVFLPLDGCLVHLTGHLGARGYVYILLADQVPR